MGGSAHISVSQPSAARDAFIVAGVSAGNDSVAQVQFLHEAAYTNVTCLYNSTGWERADWPARLDAFAAWVTGLGYTFVRTDSIGMKALVRSKKAWPRQGMQFCTEQLKQQPTVRWLDEHDPLGAAICTNGKKRADGFNRTTEPDWIESSPFHGGRPVWQCIAGVSEAERDALVLRSPMPLLPHRSRECKVCINFPRAELAKTGEDDIADIEAFEAELGVTSKGKPRTMFRPYRHMGATGIRAVVKWSKSKHGKFNPDDGTDPNADMCSSFGGGWCGG